MKLGFNSKQIMDHEDGMAMKKARIYISGKITGAVDLNYGKFHTTENRLYFNYGPDISVVNPHKLPHLHDKKWNSYMKEDLRHLLACHVIVMLDDWKESRGAILEILVAQAVAIPSYMLIDGKLIRLKVSFWNKVYLFFKLCLKSAQHVQE